MIKAGDLPENPAEVTLTLPADQMFLLMAVLALGMSVVNKDVDAKQMLSHVSAVDQLRGALGQTKCRDMLATTRAANDAAATELGIIRPPKGAH